VVLSSGPILAALSEAIDRGMSRVGIYDGPQMDQVRRQWQAAHLGADKINTWDKGCRPSRATEGKVHLRHGSLGDIAVRRCDVCFTPESRRWPTRFMSTRPILIPL